MMPDMLRTQRRKARTRSASPLAGLCLGLLIVVSAPTAALAQPEEREIIDARLEGYAAEKNQPVNVTLEGGSTALTWVTFTVLAVIGLGAMFKDAKRTHLD
jgi:hypothetical protein